MVRSRIDAACAFVTAAGTPRRASGPAVAHLLERTGRLIARYLDRPVQDHEPFVPSDPFGLRQSLEPGDVLLVEGTSRISRIIKYLTQSTWSHAALYVGAIAGAVTPYGEPHVLIEAEISEGVVSSPLSKYYPYHTRICRPVGLSREDCETVCRYAIDRIGFDSISILDFIYDVEDRFRVQTEIADLVAMEEVGDLIDYLEARLSG